MLHAVLCLAPALALALLLLARRYPGERALLVMHRRKCRRLPRPERILGSGVCGAAKVIRGGLLIGSSLAVRPPPLRSLAAS